MRMFWAWCFDHGTMHVFDADRPWCTARWVPFVAQDPEEAERAKRAAYGDARFLHELSDHLQLAVLANREGRR